MKRIERLNLIDMIGRELQSRMTFADIDVYLTGFGIDCRGRQPSANSKWVYVKELLADQSEETILKIADELEIDHGFALRSDLDIADSKFWLPGHFRLFISHTSDIKVQASRLQAGLRKYGVTGFVAHEDIEPTKDWQQEIEKALFSMDALAAILTPNFPASRWTDQEVGVAIGRDVLVVPIRHGLDPYGFVAKYQGLQAVGGSVGEVAKAIFEVLVTNSRTHGKLTELLVGFLLSSASEAEASHWLSLLCTPESVPTRHLEKLRENALGNTVLRDSARVCAGVNELLGRSGLANLTPAPPLGDALGDADLPF